ncbi:hypothetical protein VNI00_013928 [Paramarasmius palmivorus]|uniref:Uncharacterized protein n=1 Tax=Paramarasmius palmivorus TaxID=297713 RepID=A0AAW0BUL8_9AGAR
MPYASNSLFPRRMVVDDADPRVKYETGSWSLDDTGTFNSLSSFGDPFKNTMHGTSENGASFSFTFEGEYVSVWGAKDNRKVQPNGYNDDLTKLAQWRCQVDGLPIQRVNYLTPTSRITNNLLCETSGLSPNVPHVLTLNVSIQDPQTQTFWLDNIEYTPGPNVSLAGEIMKFDSSDVNARYDNNSGSWIPDTGTSSSGPLFNQTGMTGASMTFRFNGKFPILSTTLRFANSAIGTSVSLYGFNEGDTARVASSGRYSIDGLNETDFVLPGSKLLPGDPSGQTVDHYNQLSFTSPDLAPGTHDLTVTFTGVRGNESMEWLAVDYFHVTASEGTGADLVGDAEHGSESTPRGSPGKGSAGAIAGGCSSFEGEGRAAYAPLGDGYFDPKLDSLSYEISGVSPYPYTRMPAYNQCPPGKQSMTAYDSYQGSVGASSSASTSASTHSHAPSESSLQDMKSAQRAVVTQDVEEVRHQDSGIRYTQTRRVIDIPPDYTPQ